MQVENKIEIYIFFLLVVFLVGCKNETCKNKDDVYKVNTFEYIDLSIYDGWSDYYSLKLLNDGNMYVNNYRHRRGNIYFKFNIGNGELDSVSNIVGILLKSSVDTLYYRSCHDCSSYNLIIETSSKKFKSFVQGVDNHNTSTQDMNGLVSFLHNIVRYTTFSIDSVFNFESKTSYFSPPPPPPRLQDTLIKE